MNKSPAIFDITKLTWMNGCYIRALSLEEFHKLAEPYYQECLSRKVDEEFLSKVLQPRVEVLGDIPNQIDFIEQVKEFSNDLYFNKKMKSDAEVAKKTLAEAKVVLSKADVWTNEALFESLKALAETLGVKNGQILYPLRIALSGKETTPGGATEIAVILGKDETINRINQALARL